MQIHLAAWRGDRDEVLRQLALGATIDVCEESSGATSLILAAGSPEADAEFLGFLLKLGAGIDTAGTELSDGTALMAAARSNDLAKVDFLIEAGADVRFRSRDGYTALITGCSLLPTVTRRLLDAGAETDGETRWSESALSVASRDSHWPVVRLLLEAGADPAPLQWTPLMQAVVLGTTDDIIAELSVGGDLAVRDRWERTPWLHAVCTGDIDKARLLAERGSDFHAHGRGGDTALMYAAMRNDALMTEWLLSLALDVNEATEFGDTALHAAAQCGAVHVIPVLLTAGADVYSSNSVSTQPIDEASTIETVRLLVDAGADINYVNGQGDCLLKSAAEDSDTEFVRALLALGASVDTASTGETALHTAVKQNALGIMRLLLDAGADPNAQDVDGWGTLWYACTVDAVEILLEAGTDVHLTNGMGQEALACQTDIEIQARLIAAGCALSPPGGAPLMSAVERGDLRQVQFLLDAGAIVNTATGWGQTPLMEAAENSFAEGVRLLLSAGADVSLQDLLSAGTFAALQERGGRTALHHAAAPEAFTAYTLAQDVIAKYGTESDSWVHLGTYGYVESDSVECLSLLTEAGADINAADAAGFTPLLLAAACGRASRVAGLLALGADIHRRTADGKSVLELAEAHPREDQRELILRVLETYGAA